MDEEIPHWVQDDDEGRAWRNTNTGTILGVFYDDEIEDWIVTGQNTRLYVEDSEEDAKEKAKEWMLDHPKPSPMV